MAATAGIDPLAFAAVIIAAVAGLASLVTVAIAFKSMQWARQDRKLARLESLYRIVLDVEEVAASEQLNDLTAKQLSVRILATLVGLPEGQFPHCRNLGLTLGKFEAEPPLPAIGLAWTKVLQLAFNRATVELDLAIATIHDKDAKSVKYPAADDETATRLQELSRNASEALQQASRKASETSAPQDESKGGSGTT